jgi:hypothetical protein
VTREPDGELSFRTPYGEILPAVPVPASALPDPVDALRAQHDALGIQIHSHTSTPSWLGKRLDLDYAIAVLHPLACRPSASV